MDKIKNLIKKANAFVEKLNREEEKPYVALMVLNLFFGLFYFLFTFVVFYLFIYDDVRIAKLKNEFEFKMFYDYIGLVLSWVFLTAVLIRSCRVVNKRYKNFTLFVFIFFIICSFFMFI